MANLVPCEGCTRHVGVTETECPFCGHQLDAATRVHRIIPSAPRNLSRAAAIALIASGIYIGCGDDEGSGNVSAYGAPSGDFGGNGPVGPGGAGSGANGGEGGTTTGN